MNEIFKGVKKEILTLLISVIFLTFLVGLLINVVFDAFYKDNKQLFVSFVVGLLIVSAALAFLVLSSTHSNSVSQAQLTFTFDRNKPEFKDIPNCKSSVHARIYFDKLEQKHKEYLSTLCELKKFHNSDFSNFVNQIIQEVLIGLVLNDKLNVHLADVKFAELPTSLRKNKYLQQWLEPENTIKLPQNYEILMRDADTPFFKVTSPYGTAKFQWNLVISNSPRFTAGFLQTLGSDIKGNSKDIYSIVTMKVSLNYWMMLTKGTKQFVEWSTGVAERLAELDWEITEKKLPLVLMEEMIKKINNLEKSIH